MSMPGLRARLERHIDTLPVLPTVVARLMTVDQDSDDYFEEVLELIEGDPSFAACILAAANSAASAPVEPVVSIRAALVRLGGVGATRPIMAAAVSRVFVPRDDWEKSLWRHAVQVAEATRALLAFDRSGFAIDRDLAYAAGLLHDVGRFVMFQEAPDVLKQIDEGHWETPESLVATELSIAGVNHAELGAMACHRWHLPDLLVDVVARHHNSIGRLTGPADVLIGLVRFADLAMFPSAKPGSPGYAEADDERYESELMPRLPFHLGDVTVDQLRALVVETTDRAERRCQTLGLV